MLQTFKIAAITMLSCLYCFAVQGQNIDSLMASQASDKVKAKALSEYACSISESNPDSSRLMAGAVLKIAVKTGDSTDYAWYFHAMGFACYRSGRFDSAIQYLASAKTIFHRVHDTASEIELLKNLSSVSTHMEDFQPALNYLLAAIQLSGSRKEKEYPFDEIMIGMIYRDQGKYADAKVYLNKAADDYLRINEQESYADAVGDLGNVYLDLTDFDSATYCYHKALDIYLGLKTVAKAVVIYENLGDAFLGKCAKGTEPWLDTSLLYYQRAFDLLVKLKNSQDFAVLEIHMSEALIKKKKYLLAQQYLLDARDVFRTKSATYYNYITLTLLSTLYNEMHDYHKAYDFLAQANLYNDTLNLETKNKAMADMLAKYEGDKKDRNIALLNTKNKLLTTQKELIEIFSLVVVALSVFLGFVLMNRYRIQQKLQEMQMRNRISNDLHDDVGSSLSSILLLSNIASSDNVHKPELVRKISENAKEAIERISDIIWTTNPKYDDGENLRAKIVKYTMQLRQIPGIAISVNISDAIKHIKFPMETRKNIYLIVKEATNNILKHAQATRIGITISVVEKNILLEIIDNGTGFDNTAAYAGNGLETMRLRAENIGGKLVFCTSEGKGTKISGTIPVPQQRFSTIKK